MLDFEHVDFAELILVVVISIQDPKPSFLMSRSPNVIWTSDHCRYEPSLAEMVAIQNYELYSPSSYMDLFILIKMNRLDLLCQVLP